MKRTHLRMILSAGAVILILAAAIRLLYRPVGVRKPIAPTARLVKLDEELRTIQAAIAAKPNDVQPRWQLADFFQKLGRLDKAAEAVADIQRMKPQSADAAVALGNIALANKDDRRAGEVFADAARRWPRSVPALQGLSTVRFHQRMYGEAAEIANRAVKANIEDPNSHFLLASALLHYALEFPDPMLRAGDLRKARETFRRLLGYWPDRGELYLMAGKAEFALNDKAEAIKHLRRAQELLPSNADAAVFLARSYVNSAERDRARGALDAALARKIEAAPVYDLLAQLTAQAGQHGDEQKVVQLARNAVRLAPNDARYHQHLGTAYLRVADLAAARAEFERAAKLDPEAAFPYQQLAAIYSRQGDTVRAGAAAKMATQMVFNSSQLTQVQLLALQHPDSLGLHLVLADRYRDLGKIEASRDEYRWVLRLDPKNRRAKDGIDNLNRVALAQGVAR